MLNFDACKYQVNDWGPTKKNFWRQKYKRQKVLLAIC